jgi:hypothetical protein
MFRRNCSVFFLLKRFSFEQKYDQDHREEKKTLLRNETSTSGLNILYGRGVEHCGCA